MKKLQITPPIVIGSLILLVIGITLFFHFRAEDRREQHLIHCKEVAIGMPVHDVLQIMGEPDDTIQSNSAPNVNRLDLIQYIYQAPLDTYKTIVIVFDAEQMIVVHTECVE